ncbi:MAG TPA: Nudix family hydrolase [Methylophilaceae bacterium]
MTDSIIVHAAVAVFMRSDGAVLLAQRPAGKPWAGWWEFPGGKVEAGETAIAALHREVQEELGSTVLTAYPWLTRTFAYPEKTVKLHFFMVRDWQTEPHGREGQLLSWQMPPQLDVAPMLPANEPILNALALPPTYAITNMAELGEQEFFLRLEYALQNGLKLIQVREKNLSHDALRKFAQAVIVLANKFNARVLINGDQALAHQVGAAGVHYSSQQLMTLREKPADLLCAASCHNQQELAQAQLLGLDFVVCSPVLPTLSHMDAPTLGWQKFGEIIQDCSLPIYALGGLSEQDMQQAWAHGAHGIAMQRSVWKARA